MKKSELIEAIAEKAGLTKVEAGKALDATFEVIANQLEKGEKVPVAGFGTFKLSSRAAREGSNPKTGETIKIAASTSVSFKAGTALKDKVNK